MVQTKLGYSLPIAFLLNVIAWSIPSFSQVSNPGKIPPAESNAKDQGNAESEGSEKSAVEQDFPTANPDGSDPGQNPPVGNQPSAPASAQPAPRPPSVAILPASLPNVSRRAMNVKRDRGDLPAVGKLAKVKGLLLDPAPPSGYSDEILKRIAALNESSHAQGNENLVGTAFENDPTRGSPSALALGETANLILSDYILAGDFPQSAGFEQTVLSANDFAVDVTSVWDHLSPDAFPTASYSAVVGRNLSLGGGTHAYESLLVGSDDTFLIAATSGLSYSGSGSFSGSASRVVLIGGGTVSASAGSRLDSAVADLVVASRSDWSVADAAFAAGNKLYLRSLGDLTLTNVELSATEQVRLEALMDLSLDSTRFSAGLLEIQMRATTIDLKNVEFPSGSVIDLHALKGGLDGKYPTFGPEARAYGRVNFLQKVSHGGNSINDRSSFDLHGTKINISKLP